MVILNSHCSFYIAATLFSRYVYPNLWNRYCSELFFIKKRILMFAGSHILISWQCLSFAICISKSIRFIVMWSHYLKDSPYLFSGLSFLLYQTVARNKLKGRKDLFCLISKRKSLWEDVECLHIFAINFLSNILTLIVIYIPG